MKPKDLPKPASPPDSFHTAVRQWTEGKLNSRSGYYAGRGPKRCDLNEDYLQMLFQGISKDFSPKHADLFVDFVEKLTDLSASAFLVAFEYFFNSGCSNPECYQQRPGDFAMPSSSSYGDTRNIEAEFGILSALTERRSPGIYEMESDGIKYGFLRMHGRKIPKERSVFDPFS